MYTYGPHTRRPARSGRLGGIVSSFRSRGPSSRPRPPPCRSHITKHDLWGFTRYTEHLLPVRRRLDAARPMAGSTYIVMACIVTAYIVVADGELYTCLSYTHVYTHVNTHVHAHVSARWIRSSLPPHVSMHKSTHTSTHMATHMPIHVSIPRSSRSRCLSLALRRAHQCFCYCH